MRAPSVRKARTYFEQVRVEDAKKIAEQERSGKQKAASGNLIREPGDRKAEPDNGRLASVGRRKK